MSEEGVMNGRIARWAAARPLAACLSAVLFVLSLALVPTPAAALVWPDVADRIERDLSAPDPATRRTAARQLRSLGPTRGAPLAVAALSDPDDDVRLSAADAAIRLRAAGATDAVTGWLNAPDVRVRRKACEVARALPSPRAIAPLARTLGDPDPEVRAEAAEALGRQMSAEAVAPLLGRLDDATPAVRIQIIAALARLGDARAVVPLVGKVEDSSPEVRQAVVRALGDLGDARASSALVLALRDQSADVRRDSLAALGRMHAAEAVDAIAPFTADPAPPLRLAALSALGRIATPDAKRVLVDALGMGDDGAGSLDATPVREALVATGASGIPSLRAVLAGTPSPQAATSAAWVLGALHARDEAPSIVLAMRRGVLPPAAALHALAGAGTGAQVPVVLEFVADRSPVVRSEAIAAALALLDPSQPDGRAVEPLAAALRGARPTAHERARIATLLGRTGAPRAAPPLVELTHAQDPVLRLAAIDALGTLGANRTGEAGSQADRDGSDQALLDALGSPDAAVRLHAATALSDAGAERARDALMGMLDRGDEVDRAAVLTALGGVLARLPNEASVAKLAALLELAAGPERDALVEAIGRAPLASATHALGRVARSEEPSDRRAVAAMCAAHAGDATAIAIARALLGDADASVRAQAAWSLGAIGDDSDLPRLEAVTRAAEIEAAVDASAAIGRIAARSRTARAANPVPGRLAPTPADPAVRVLCSLLVDPRVFVRANAFAGLALAGGRCLDGSPERAALLGDSAEDARAAAVLAVSRDPSPEDARALDRCARTDPSPAVATRCQSRAPAASTARTHPTLVYVVPDGSDVPKPNAAYAVLFADGMLRAGTTDRRGAVFEPLAPEGEVTLRRPVP
jgi:HEAT repeat protein